MEAPYQPDLFYNFYSMDSLIKDHVDQYLGDTEIQRRSTLLRFRSVSKKFNNLIIRENPELFFKTRSIKPRNSNNYITEEYSQIARPIKVQVRKRNEKFEILYTHHKIMPKNSTLFVSDEKVEKAAGFRQGMVWGSDKKIEILQYHKKISRRGKSLIKCIDQIFFKTPHVFFHVHQDQLYYLKDKETLVRKSLPTEPLNRKNRQKLIKEEKRVQQGKTPSPTLKLSLHFEPEIKELNFKNYFPNQGSLYNLADIKIIAQNDYLILYDEKKMILFNQDLNLVAQMSLSEKKIYSEKDMPSIQIIDGIEISLQDLKKIKEITFIDDNLIQITFKSRFNSDVNQFFKIDKNLRVLLPLFAYFITEKEQFIYQKGMVIHYTPFKEITYWSVEDQKRKLELDLSPFVEYDVSTETNEEESLNENNSPMENTVINLQNNTNQVNNTNQAPPSPRLAEPFLQNLSNPQAHQRMIKEDYTFYYSEKGFAFVKLQTTGEEQYQSKIIYRSMENDQFEMATIPGKFLGIIEEYLLVKAKRKHSWGEERLVNFYNLQYPFKVKEGKDNRLGEFNYAGYEGVRVKDGQLIGVFGVNRYIIKIEEIIKRCPVKKFKVKAVKKEKEKKGGKET